MGWIPVDATAPADAAQDNLRKFGKDSGKYLATGMETDWEISLPRQGLQKLIWLHNYAVADRAGAGRTPADLERQESTRLLEATGPINAQ